MRAPQRKDVLDEMTKQELVAWMRDRCFFNLPRMSDVLFLRWQRQSDEVIEARRKESLALQSIDIAEHDRLARLFNQSKDPATRLQLLEQMEPYAKALQDHSKRYQAIERKQERVDALYRQLEAERNKE